MVSGITNYFHGSWPINLRQGPRLLAEKGKLLAEKGKLLAEKGKLLAEKGKLLAETEMLSVSQQRAKLDLRVAQFGVQDKLEEENGKYKAAMNRFGDLLEAMTARINSGRDASEQRNKAIKCLTSDMIDAFSAYIEKAKTGYIEHSSDVVQVFIESEIIPIIEQIDYAVIALNSDVVLKSCLSSKTPLGLTLASFGPVKRCLLELAPRLSADSCDRIREKLLSLGEIGKTVCLPSSASASMVRQAS